MTAIGLATVATQALQDIAVELELIVERLNRISEQKLPVEVTDRAWEAAYVTAGVVAKLRA